MVASYTSNLRLTQQGDNDNPNSWGQIVNTQVIQLIEDAIAGVKTVDITGSSDVNLSTTTVSGGTDDARYAVLQLTGIIGADIDLILPSVNKIYIIRSSYTGDYTVTVKPIGASSGIEMSKTQTVFVYTNGTNIYEVSPAALLIANNLSDLADVATARTNLGLGALATKSTVNNGDWSGTDLAVANGGTGASTAEAGLNSLLPTQTGNSGKFLTTNGTTHSWATSGIENIGKTTQVRNSSNQGLSNGNVWTLLSFDTEDYDDLAIHDNTTNNSRLTVAETGVYLIELVVAVISPTNDHFGAAVFKNGNTDATFEYGMSSWTDFGHNYFTVPNQVYTRTVTAVAKLTAGDYLQGYGYCWGQASCSARALETRFRLTRIK